MKQPARTKVMPQEVCLSDYGLKSRMTVREILYVVESLKNRLNEDVFAPIESEVMHNLKNMEPGKVFNYQKYFSGLKREVFIVISFRYIIEHRDYEFNTNYSLIRRTR